MKFYELYIRGLVNKDQIHDYIDKWHNSDSELKIYDYLGLTEQQYKNWVEFDSL